MIWIQTSELEEVLTALNYLPCAHISFCLPEILLVECVSVFLWHNSEYQIKKYDLFLCQASDKPCLLGCDWGMGKRGGRFRPQYLSCHWRGNKDWDLQIKLMCFPSQGVLISSTTLWSVVRFGPYGERETWQIRRVRNVPNYFTVGKCECSTPVEVSAYFAERHDKL